MNIEEPWCDTGIIANFHAWDRQSPSGGEPFKDKPRGEVQRKKGEVLCLVGDYTRTIALGAFRRFEPGLELEHITYLGTVADSTMMGHGARIISCSCITQSTASPMQ